MENADSAETNNLSFRNKDGLLGSDDLIALYTYIFAGSMLAETHRAQGFCLAASTALAYGEAPQLKDIVETNGLSLNLIEKVVKAKTDRVGANIISAGGKNLYQELLAGLPHLILVDPVVENPKEAEGHAIGMITRDLLEPGLLETFFGENEGNWGLIVDTSVLPIIEPLNESTFQSHVQAAINFFPNQKICVGFYTLSPISEESK